MLLILKENILPNTNLFRPPFGKMYPWQISKIKEKYKIIMWDVLSGDFDQSISKEKCLKNVIKNTTMVIYLQIDSVIWGFFYFVFSSKVRYP